VGGDEDVAVGGDEDGDEDAVMGVAVAKTKPAALALTMPRA
jgi:hypothetical protein